MLNTLRRSRALFLQRLREIAQSVRPRVLVADDNFTYARLLSQALERRGIATDIALDEPSVRGCLAKHRYDLVVVDGAFDPDGTEVPVLYVSGEGDNTRVDVSKSIGISGIADRINREVDEIAARVR